MTTDVGRSERIRVTCKRDDNHEHIVEIYHRIDIARLHVGNGQVRQDSNRRYDLSPLPCFDRRDGVVNVHSYLP